MKSGNAITPLFSFRMNNNVTFYSDKLKKIEGYNSLIMNFFIIT